MLWFFSGRSQCVTNSIDPDGNYKTEPEKVVEQAAEQKDVP